MALLTSHGNYKIDRQPFELLTPHNAGLLGLATRVIFSLHDFPTPRAQEAGQGAAQMLLKWDREGGLCLPKSSGEGLLG